MDVCQIKIPGSISGDAFTPCHESELVFTARWFVEVTFAFITWQQGLRLWEQQTTTCNLGFCWVNREADWPFAVSLE